MAEDLKERIRNRLEKDFGAHVYERDFTLGIRIPFNQVTELRNTDVPTLKQTIEDIGLDEIEEKTVTTLIVAKENSVEFETVTLLRVIKEENIEPIHESFVSTSTQKLKNINDKLRDLIDEMSRKPKKGVSGESKGGAKIEESYKLGGRGRVVGNRKARDDVNFDDVALVPTIKNAVRKGNYRSSRWGSRVEVKKEHLRENIYRSRTKLYKLLIVDTSYMPDETRKIRTVEEIVKTILTITYEKRSQVGIISSSGDEAELELPFTSEVSKGEEVLDGLEYGGLSPLPSALKKGLTLLERAKGSRADVILMMILITRGKANVPLFPGGYTRRELMKLGKMIGNSTVKMAIVNVGDEETNILKEMASRARARYYEPPLLADKVEDAKDILDSIDSGEDEKVVEAGKRFLKDLENP